MSDSDDPGMCRVFAVKDTGEDFDLDIPPTSGLEYLRRVQYVLFALKCVNATHA